MPTYEYKCDACGNAFEKFQSITSQPVRKCPKCGKLKVRRLISTGAGIIFKGSGFYITDYRSEGYKSAAKADAPSSGSETKTDSKTETKAPDSKPSESKSSDAKTTDTKPAATTSESKPAPKAESKPPTASKSARKR